MMKGEYITAIKSTGFQDVRIIDEASFPVECMANDATAKAIIENLRIPSEKLKELKDIASSVVSIKVHGIKPNKAAPD